MTGNATVKEFCETLPVVLSAAGPSVADGRGTVAAEHRAQCHRQTAPLAVPCNSLLPCEHLSCK